ncbi:MAG: DUF1007 family protein [Pseudomonadota bacterium]
MTRVCSCLTAIALTLFILAQAKPVQAHPHVFVDAKIGLVVSEDRRLEAIRIVWLFDAFHTLYILSFDGITPTAEGGLTQAAKAQLSKSYTDWQRGFDGFAKLLIGGELIKLDIPSNVEASLVAGQLEVSFTRALPNPISLRDAAAQIAVYDETYYHAVTVAEPPDFQGDALKCKSTLIPFNPDAQDRDVQETLSKLNRDEMSAVDGIGASFADRITFSCA